MLHLTEWEEFRAIDPEDLSPVVRRKQILDGRNKLELDTWRSAGWTVRGLGRRSSTHLTSEARTQLAHGSSTTEELDNTGAPQRITVDSGLGADA